MCDSDCYAPVQRELSPYDAVLGGLGGREVVMSMLLTTPVRGDLSQRCQTRGQPNDRAGQPAQPYLYTKALNANAFHDARRPSRGPLYERPLAWFVSRAKACVLSPTTIMWVTPQLCALSTVSSRSIVRAVRARCSEAKGRL